MNTLFLWKLPLFAEGINDTAIFVSYFLYKETFDNKGISAVINDGDNADNSVCNYPSMMVTHLHTFNK